jgi:hypothetical protein
MKIGPTTTFGAPVDDSVGEDVVLDVTCGSPDVELASLVAVGSTPSADPLTLVVVDPEVAPPGSTGGGSAKHAEMLTIAPRAVRRCRPIDRE